jgi:hypothetical protein
MQYGCEPDQAFIEDPERPHSPLIIKQRLFLLAEKVSALIQPNQIVLEPTSYGGVYQIRIPKGSPEVVAWITAFYCCDLDKDAIKKLKKKPFGDPQYPKINWKQTSWHKQSDMLVINLREDMFGLEIQVFEGTLNPRLLNKFTRTSPLASIYYGPWVGWDQPPLRVAAVNYCSQFKEAGELSLRTHFMQRPNGHVCVNHGGNFYFNDAITILAYAAKKALRVGISKKSVEYKWLEEKFPSPRDCSH